MFTIGSLAVVAYVAFSYFPLSTCYAACRLLMGEIAYTALIVFNPLASSFIGPPGRVLAAL